MKYLLLDLYGVFINMRKQLTEEQKEYLKENFNKLSITEIVNYLEICKPTLYKILRELKIDGILIKNGKISKIRNKRPDKFERNCPKCNDLIKHSNSNNCYSSERKKVQCKNCDKKWREKFYKGINNPFYGKKHTEEFKNNLSVERKGKHFSPETQFKKGQETLNKIPVLKIWKEKYNEETYNLKVKNLKEKQSKNAKGKNNSMYGKPSPNGSGNGWSGWYKDWFFRSLNELSYMVQIIEKYNLLWESGEQEKWKILYTDYKNEKRNYFPDFIIGNKYIVECKPKKLWSTPSVVSKTNAAKEFCKKNNMKYKLVECSKLSIEKIKELYSTNLIKFTNKYEEKFRLY